jgi:hypothetical protein
MNEIEQNLQNGSRFLPIKPGIGLVGDHFPLFLLKEITPFIIFVLNQVSMEKRQLHNSRNRT